MEVDCVFASDDLAHGGTLPFIRHDENLQQTLQFDTFPKKFPPKMDEIFHDLVHEIIFLTYSSGYRKRKEGKWVNIQWATEVVLKKNHQNITNRWFFVKLKLFLKLNTQFL